MNSEHSVNRLKVKKFFLFFVFFLMNSRSKIFFQNKQAAEEANSNGGGGGVVVDRAAMLVELFDCELRLKETVRQYVETLLVCYGECLCFFVNAVFS